MMDEYEENPYQSPEEVSELNSSLDENGDELASLGRRLAGSIIDTIILIIITAPILLFTGALDIIVDAVKGVETVSEPSILDELKQSLLFLAVFYAINGYFLVRTGQTIGKKILGTRIVSAETGQLTDGLPMIGKRYLILQGIQLIPKIGALYGLVDACFIFGKKRQRLSDRIAKTKVIRIQPDIYFPKPEN